MAEGIICSACVKISQVKLMRQLFNHFQNPIHVNFPLGQNGAGVVKWKSRCLSSPQLDLTKPAWNLREGNFFLSVGTQCSASNGTYASWYLNFSLFLKESLFFTRVFPNGAFSWKLAILERSRKTAFGLFVASIHFLEIFCQGRRKTNKQSNEHSVKRKRKFTPKCDWHLTLSLQWTSFVSFLLFDASNCISHLTFAAISVELQQRARRTFGGQGPEMRF